MIAAMDDAEIERLRRAIRRTYASQPHKIKCWLAVLEMYSNCSTTAASATGSSKRLDIRRVAVDPLRYAPPAARQSGASTPVRSSNTRVRPAQAADKPSLVRTPGPASRPLR